MVSTCDNKNVRTVGRCVGLNKRSLRRVVQCMKLLEIKVGGEKWAKSDKNVGEMFSHREMLLLF
jgi:hypothetical protein